MNVVIAEYAKKCLCVAVALTYCMLVNACDTGSETDCQGRPLYIQSSALTESGGTAYILNPSYGVGCNPGNPTELPPNFEAPPLDPSVDVL